MKLFAIQLTMTAILFLIPLFIEAQPSIDWEKSLGGSGSEDAYAVQQTTDGGYIVAGWTTSFDGDVTNYHGGLDYWVVKLNSTGAITWQKAFGGTGNERANAVQQTSDGGYIVAGLSNSTNGDITANHGSYDYWIIKLDGTGMLMWEKSFGGTGIDYAESIQQTSDGGYIVVGRSNSTNGDITANKGLYDYWTIKLDSTGVLIWEKSLGGTSIDEGYSILQTRDSGYIVVGESYSNDGDVTGNHGDADLWVAKLNHVGAITWQKSIGGTDLDYGYSIQQTKDGGYIILGSTESNDGDVTHNHGHYDYWLVKLSLTGSLMWQKTLGGTNRDHGFSIQQTIDGGYIVAGSIESNDGDVTHNHGYSDYWLAKLSPTGSIIWEKSLGGTSLEQGRSIQQTTDGGYIIVGEAHSNDGDISNNYGGSDFWVVKLSSFVGVNKLLPQKTLKVYPNPTKNNVMITIDAKSMGAFYTIYNNLGQLVQSGQLQKSNTTVKLADLQNGIYTIKVQTLEGIVIARVIKKD